MQTISGLPSRRLLRCMSPLLNCKSRLLGSSAISLRTAGFDLPTLTHSTQLSRYAMRVGSSGWWPSDQRCEPPQVLGDGGQNELILGASWTAQSKPAELQDALEVRKPHLDLLALAPRKPPVSRIVAEYRQSERGA